MKCEIFKHLFVGIGEAAKKVPQLMDRPLGGWDTGRAIKEKITFL